MSRTAIKYIPGNRAGVKEDPEKEGIIEVRPGTKGIYLGDKKYAMACVRVLDDRHYFKGMCLYSDSLPDGYDVICYYGNPSRGLEVLKTDNGNSILSKEIMTEIFDNAQWTAWKEVMNPAPHLAYEFLKKKEGQKHVRSKDERGRLSASREGK